MHTTESLGGVINVYKEKGYTSHDVVAIVRRLSGRMKTGHTGTLDPMAEGVLPICLGRATKLADYLQDGDKTYEAVVQLGITTDTEDITGEILSRNDVHVQEDAVRGAVSSFCGTYMQIPPMYSAIKINGKKLYKLARSGKIVERPGREVTLRDISVTAFLPGNKFQMTVTCSKGTYIRSLARDIGERLQCGACMAALTRKATGGFTIENSIRLEALKRLQEEGRFFEAVTPVDKALLLDRAQIKAAYEVKLRNGATLPVQAFLTQELEEGRRYFVYDSEDRLCGLYLVMQEAGQLVMKPKIVFNTLN